MGHFAHGVPGTQRQRWVSLTVENFGLGLLDPPLLHRDDAVHRTGADPPGLLHDSDLAHNSGGDRRAPRPDHTVPGVGREVRPSRSDCQVNAAALALRVGHRGPRVLAPVPSLSAGLKKADVLLR